MHFLVFLALFSSSKSSFQPFSGPLDNASTRRTVGAYKLSPQEYSVNETLVDWVTKNTFPGISKQLMTEHTDLYRGYVKNANALLANMANSSIDTPMKLELGRRFGFEANGIHMHELFFSNLHPSPAPPSNNFLKIISDEFGSYRAFLDRIRIIGGTRGIGWVTLTLDKSLNRLILNWVSEHQDGQSIGDVILAVDCWEHAYIRDYKSTARGDYLQNLVKIIDWEVVEKRLKAAM
ncbi:putative superoxide dismutase [Blattamonas nauphoetae]|uniref:superoxide dismutase n=1 Tax=Blattamonas nauphoetae TaxID=2049346 RepID=A0ABQ9X8A9_9EUKA|nr:putative superoxide dismutase [Blattamonas nauphoetae]